MKVNLKMIILMGKENIPIKMEIYTKEILLMIISMGKELFISLMEKNMSEIGKMM